MGNRAQPQDSSVRVHIVKGRFVLGTPAKEAGLASVPTTRYLLQTFALLEFRSYGSRRRHLKRSDQYELNGDCYTHTRSYCSKFSLRKDGRSPAAEEQWMKVL